MAWCQRRIRCKSITLSDEEVNVEAIEREQDIYRRLGTVVAWFPVLAC